MEYKRKELEKNKIWREENKEAILQQKKEYYAKNKEQIQKSKRLLYLERRKRIFNDELTKFVKEEAKDLVRMRTELFGFTWSVDHLVPLKGKTVSGLDIWSNIQVIPLSLNKRKYNSYADCT